MNFQYEFPKQTAFGRVLPKSKIYNHGSVSPSLKKRFIHQVDKIIWSYKLAPETINIPAKDSVQEIQVFTVLLKEGDLKYEVLGAIDKAIQTPILFVLSFGDKFRYVSAYKRPSESDKDKWVVSPYFESEWMTPDAPKVPLPMALDLSSLYKQILDALIPLQPREGESMNALVGRVEKVRNLERKAKKLETRLKKEKQFNRKVEINSELQNLQQEIQHLST